jgi:lipopolysaccharide biosynthesis protein
VSTKIPGIAPVNLEKKFHPLVEISLYVVGLLRRLRTAVRGTWDGEAAPSKKHVVYVNFDGQSRIHEYVFFQIRCFADLGYAVTFVTNSLQVHEQELKRLLPLCRKIIWRRNIAYDFGGYRDGLKAIPDQEKAEQIILTNDSSYGPFFPLEEYLARCTPDDADIWGMTDSHQIAHHLQSYFLLLHPPAIISPTLRKFWRWFPYVGGKKWAILKGELRFSATAVSAGLRLKSLFSSSKAQARISKYRELTEFTQREDVAAYREYLDRHFENASMLNPMSYFWDVLIEFERFPYLKKDLFSPGGRARIAERRPWADLISDVSQYDTALATSHMKSLEAHPVSHLASRSSLSSGV